MCEKEPKRRSCTTCPQYDGATCQATGFQLGDKETVLASENRRGFICVDTGEGTPHNAFVMTTRIVDSDPAGSPSSECPSLRDGPPQKGKIAENSHLHNTTRCALIRNPEATCRNCNKSHAEGDRLVCYKWGIQNILMPYRPCEKWAQEREKWPLERVHQYAPLQPLSMTIDNAQSEPALPKGVIAYQDGIELTPQSSWIMHEAGELLEAPNASFSKRPAENTCITYVSNTPESNAVFTTEEISQLTDALRTIQRILGQHGVTLP